jgi:hypothetical protein
MVAVEDDEVAVACERDRVVLTADVVALLVAGAGCLASWGGVGGEHGGCVSLHDIKEVR